MSNNDQPHLPCAPGLRRAVVTGSSSGIGCAITAHLLAQGWHVLGLDISAPAIVHAAFEPVQVDLASRNDIARVASQCQKVEALIHAAGVLRVGELGQLDPAAGELMWRLHVEGASCLADVLVPQMAERGQGRVVFIGSRVAQGMPGRGQYAATKAALTALARSWAAEVAVRGVTVNVVSPAATQTAMLQDPARVGSAPRLPPLGRLIEPTEIAELVNYLLSPSAAAITGQDIAICGGSSLPR